MPHNSRKCVPILIISSPSHSRMNSTAGKLNKTYHLTSNLLPHYRAKVECSTHAVLQHVIQCECDAESFIYSICVSEMLNSVFYVD